MKILLCAINSRHTHTAIALGYLKTFWEKDESRPKALIREYDINQTCEDIYSDIIAQKPDVVAFSVYIWSLNMTLSVCSAIKAALPDVRIILGGPEVSYTSEKILCENPFIDIIIRGEGEATFAQVCEKLIDGSCLDKVKGITFRKNQKIIYNLDQPLIENLDDIPSPFQQEVFKGRKSFTYYEASRGCPSKCRYCLSSVQGKIRNHSLQRVKGDLDYFFTSEYRQVRFADRTFNFDHKRAIEIIKYILKNNHKKINFHFEIQADFLSSEILELFKQAPEGMFHLEIGVQSTNPEALKSVNRIFQLEALKKNVQELKKHTGCHLHLDLLGGLPHDKFADFLNGLNDIWHLGPHSIQISLVKVLRGTPLLQDVEEGKIFAMQMPPYTVLRTNWLSEQEALQIQFIGKLVEGIYNCHRYQNSLQFIIDELYKKNAAQFFLDLTSFWLKKKLPFFNFSPKNIYKQLYEFAGSSREQKLASEAAKTLIEHEFHLSQKVPSGTSMAGPENRTGKNKTGFRITPGLKTLWYDYDLNKLLKREEVLQKGAFPFVYCYEKDLSKTPNTRLLNLDLYRAFVLACIDKKIQLKEFARIWKNSIPYKISQPVFTEVIESLQQEGLLYNSRNANYKEVGKLISQTQTLS
ncbi:MAG: DUF4080 domain-containing protein [Candidatus Rifleibacteriota bacterium]